MDTSIVVPLWHAVAVAKYLKILISFVWVP